MESLNPNSILFAITVEDIQFEANESLGRELTEDELYIARKGLECGLLTNIDVIYETIFFDLIGANKSLTD